MTPCLTLLMQVNLAIKVLLRKAWRMFFGSLDSLSGLFHETSARTKEEISKDIDGIEESIASRRIDVIKELFWGTEYCCAKRAWRSNW